MWLVLDASVELWAGPARARAARSRDRRGRRRRRAPPRARRSRRARRLRRRAAAGARRPTRAGAGARRSRTRSPSAPARYDADRSDLDELDVAVRVLEHLRPLDARGLADVRRGDLDKLAAARRRDARRARRSRATAPEASSAARAHAAPLPRVLRHRLAAEAASSDRGAASDTLVKTLATIAKSKPRPSLVHVLSSAPEACATMAALGESVGRLRRMRHGRFVGPSAVRAGLTPPWVTARSRRRRETSRGRATTALDAAAPHAADAAESDRSAPARPRRRAARARAGARRRAVRVHRASPATLASTDGPAEAQRRAARPVARGRSPPPGAR